MIERYSGNVEMVCDGCGESAGVYPSDDFEVMVQDAKRKGWRNQKIKGDWHNYCDTCSNTIG